MNVVSKLGITLKIFLRNYENILVILVNLEFLFIYFYIHKFVALLHFVVTRLRIGFQIVGLIQLYLYRRINQFHRFSFTSTLQ